MALACATLAPAADNWTGTIRCEINVTADGYSHQETQTWTFAGTPPTSQGSSKVYAATWNVTGKGWHDRTNASASRRVASWTANVTDRSAPISFLVSPSGELVVQVAHAQLTAPGGYTGTDQFGQGGVMNSSQRLQATVYEWPFQKIQGSPTETQLTGSRTSEVKAQLGPMQPHDAQATVTFSWALGQGRAPALPPSTLPPASRREERTEPGRSREQQNWTGAIRCEILVAAAGYSHQETQLWTLSGAAPKKEGAYEICDATWTVTGQGWHDRPGQTARRVAKWTAQAPGVRAPVAFFRPAPGRLVVQLHHGQLNSAEGYTGTEQYLNNDAPSRPERPLVQRLFEWTSWKIEPSSDTDTQITGSRSSKVTAGIAPLHPGDAEVTVTLTWALGRGSAPAMPPPTLPPMAPAPGSDAPDGRTDERRPPPRRGGPSGPTGEPAADVSGPPPRILSVTPGSAAAGTTAMVQLTGENTHWRTDLTTADFGPDIAIKQLLVQSPTQATASLSIAANAAATPRLVTLRTDLEVATTRDYAFIVTSPSPQGDERPPAPQLLSIEPASVQQGANEVNVRLLAQGTHWRRETTTVDFGPDIRVADILVNSPTDMVAIIQVAQTAAPRPRAVRLTTPVPGLIPEVVGLPDRFNVEAVINVVEGGIITPVLMPAITQVSPNSELAGSSVQVTITGRATRFAQGTTTANFGAGITVATLNVTSPTSATAILNIDGSAASGARTVTLTTGNGIATLANGFSVINLGGYTPGGGTAQEPAQPRQPTEVNSPAIAQVTPSGAPPGTRGLTVSITGSGTHFNNVSWVEFGELVGATSFTVTSPTTATAVINIDPAAPPGPRTVSIITPVEGTASIPGETASLANGFTVEAPALGGQPPPGGPPTTARMTPFDPQIHGFRFKNTFRNSVFGPPIKFFTQGLCGGMSYTALDYYLAGMAIPQQTFRPAHSTVLQEYIYRRQETSLLQNLDKWSEYDFNPFGSRNLEIFNWGLRERLVELRSFIDRGMPVPLGLKGTGGAYVNDHQVLAIGYDMGRYKGDVGQYKEDLKIFLCEPNYPGIIITMVADPAKMEFYYLNGSDRWRSYFVDGKHVKMTPPTVPNPVDPNATKDGRVHALLLTFETGDEELRGGSLHVNLKILFNDGTRQEYPNISRGGRWLPKYDETVEVVLTTPRRLDEMRSLEINTNSGPSANGWDLERLNITAVGGGFNDYYPFQVNNPLRYKFVGQALEIPRPPVSPPTADVAPVRPPERQGVPEPPPPAITDVTPNSAPQWTENLTITFTARGTNFTQSAAPTVDLGPGIRSVGPYFYVESPTRVLGSFTIAGDAAPGPRTVTIRSGNQIITLPNGFTVTPRAARDVFRLTPESGHQGQQNLQVDISTFQWRYFFLGATADFGPGITVASFEVRSDFAARAVLNIDPAAAVGPRNVTVRLPGGRVDVFPGVFTVAAAPPVSTSPAPSISLSPNSAVRGSTNVYVMITGTNTHFVHTVTTADFGPGITVNFVEVPEAPYLAKAVLNIAPDAAEGPRTVRLITGSEVVSLPNGFIVARNPSEAASSSGSAGGPPHGGRVAIGSGDVGVVPQLLPAITEVSPNSHVAGAVNTRVWLTGRATHWVNGTTTADFGADTAVTQVHVDSPTRAWVLLLITRSAAPGPRTVTVTTGSEVVSLPNGFTVSSGVSGSAFDAGGGGGGGPPTLTEVGAAKDPEWFTATQTGEARVQLNWSTVPGVSAYLVYGGPGAENGIKCMGTSATVSGLASGTYRWFIASLYGPDGTARTEPANRPSTSVTVVAMRGYYRVTAETVTMHRDEADNPGPWGDGRADEIYVTSHALSVDRRSGAERTRWPLFRSPVHGEAGGNPPYVISGTGGGNGGIQTGDVVQLRGPATSSGGYPPCWIWEGELQDGVDFLILRPVVWEYDGASGPWFTPYQQRVQSESASAIFQVPEAAATVNQGGISVGHITQFRQSGRWTRDGEDHPIGCGVGPIAPGGGGLTAGTDESNPFLTFSDRFVLLTREKLEPLLDAGNGSTVVDLRFTGNGRDWIADCTLRLKFERATPPPPSSSSSSNSGLIQDALKKLTPKLEPGG